MLENISASSVSVLRAPGLHRAMRFGRQKAEIVQPQKQQTALEQLYSLAKSTFNLHKDVERSEVERLTDVVSSVPLHELGLEEQQEPSPVAPEADAFPAMRPASNERRSLLQRIGLSGSRLPTITYMHVAENEHFGIGIFCLPAGIILPFHDHPQMTVISRVLYGEIEVVAYDWENPEERSRDFGEAKPAKLSVQKFVKAEDPPVVLYATSGGNIHSFRAKKACAILDVLAPPYDMEDPERSCTYYKEASEPLADGTVMLEKIPDPNTFRIASSKYLGVQVE